MNSAIGTEMVKKENGGLRGRAAVLALTAALVACGQESPEKLLASAHQYFKAGDYKAATIQLKNVLQQDASSKEARFMLGKTFLAQGDGSSAEFELRKALAANYPEDAVVPELARALVLQGKNKAVLTEFSDITLGGAAANADLKTSVAIAHAAEGDLARARTSIDQALAADPANEAALLAQARLMAARGDTDGALKATEALLARAPGNQAAWSFKGEQLLYSKHDAEAALPAFQKAVEIRPDFLPAYSGLLTILLGRQNLDEAEKVLAKLGKVAPHSIQTKYFEAQFAYQKKNFTKAHEAIQQVLRVAPDNPQFLQMAGAIEFQMNLLLQAEAHLAKALQAQPTLGFARRILIATYLRSGQSAKALATLPASIDQETSDGEMLELAGQVYLQNGDAKRAEVLLARAAQLDPANAGKRTTLAMARLSGGEVEAAMSQLRGIASTDAGTAADQQLINVHLRRGEFDKALAAIDNLAKKKPNEPGVSHLRGLTQLAMKDPAAARLSFEKALAMKPAFFPSAAALASLDLAAGKPEAARGRMESLLKVEPKNLQALLALAELEAKEDAPVEKVAALLDNAIKAHPADPVPRRILVDYYLNTKNNKLALDVAKSANEAIPDSPPLVDALSRAQLVAGDPARAISTMKGLAASKPDLPQAQMRLAGMYMLDKKPELAEQAWRQALKIRPDYLDAQRALIIYYVQGGKFKEALEIANTIKQQRPKEPTAWLIEGDIAVARKNWTDAAEAYRTGLKKFPTSQDLAIKLHTSLLGGGKTAEAANVAKSWSSDHPKDVAYQLHLGSAALRLRNYAEAEKYFQEALKSAPENPVVLNNLAWIAVQKKESGALEMAEKANKLAPNRAPFMDTLALALSQKGEHARALDLQKKVIALEPDNPYMRFNLARIYANAGDKANAKIELDRLADMGEKFPMQQDVAALKAAL